MFGWKRKLEQTEETVVQPIEPIVEQPEIEEKPREWTEEDHQRWHDAHAWRGPGDNRTSLERWVYSRRQRW